MIYGATGTLYFDDLATQLTAGPLQLMALVFFAVGLFFKISLVPFHLWTPDVYEGAPTSYHFLSFGYFERFSSFRTVHHIRKSIR